MYPSPCLRARESLNKSMYVNQDREHFPESMFPKWNQLTWTEKLRTVTSTAMRAPASVGTYLPGSPGLAVNPQDLTEDTLIDSELLVDKRHSPHYQAMTRGEMSGGIIVASNAKRNKDLSLMRQARIGKEVDQIFGECGTCGRPCPVAGSGLCQRCKEIELEKAMLEISEDTLKPDTYLGDPRALLGHSGFHHYVPVPRASDQIMRLKIGPEMRSRGVDDRRELLASLPSLAPADGQLLALRRKSEYCDTGRRSTVQQRPHDPSVKLDAGLNSLWTEDDVRESLERIHLMVKSNRLDDIQDLLQRTSSLQEPMLGAAKYLVLAALEKRDRFGNTPLLTAVQQGHRRICKLLISRKADVNSQNKEGNTPLHYAAMYGYHKLFGYLVKHGADDTINNYTGKLCYSMTSFPARVSDNYVLKFENKKKDILAKFPSLLNR